MTLFNILRISLMFLHRRPLRTDRTLNYHSVRGYPGLNLYMWSSVVGLPLDQEWHDNMRYSSFNLTKKIFFFEKQSKTSS